jgi:hypothetical protein
MDRNTGPAALRVPDPPDSRDWPRRDADQHDEADTGARVQAIRHGQLDIARVPIVEEKEADAPRQQEVATRPAPTTETRQLQQQPTPAPASAPASAPAPIAAGPIEDAPVQASEVIRTIVSIALKKPAKDVAFDQSVKALSGGALTRCNLLYSS